MSKTTKILSIILTILFLIVLGAVFIFPVVKPEIGINIFDKFKNAKQEDARDLKDKNIDTDQKTKTQASGVKEEKEGAQVSGTAKEESVVNESGVEIPDEVYSYQGEVVSKSPDSFKISVLSKNNFIESDQEINVRIDSNTIITRITIFKDKPSSPKIERIAFDDIGVGDNVAITTVENINGKSSVLAGSVRVLSTE